ncbi:MAG: hypothetical protein COZ06_38830, partial [Armatimonadetes bacterium CG_4_10_14_3_um_filter_66_18]
MGVRDLAERLPGLRSATWLCVHRCRVKCQRCRLESEQLRWLNRHAHVTKRLAERLALVGRAVPIWQEADDFHLHQFARTETGGANLYGTAETVRKAASEALAAGLRVDSLLLRRPDGAPLG